MTTQQTGQSGFSDIVIPAPSYDLFRYAAPTNRSRLKFHVRPGAVIHKGDRYLTLDCNGVYYDYRVGGDRAGKDLPPITLLSPVAGEVVRVGSVSWEFGDNTVTEWDCYFTKHVSSIDDYNKALSVVVRSPQAGIDSYILKQNERLVSEGCLRHRANCEKELQAVPFWRFGKRKYLKEAIALCPVPKR